MEMKLRFSGLPTIAENYTFESASLPYLKYALTAVFDPYYGANTSVIRHRQQAQEQRALETEMQAIIDNANPFFDPFDAMIADMDHPFDSDSDDDDDDGAGRHVTFATHPDVYEFIEDGNEDRTSYVTEIDLFDDEFEFDPVIRWSNVEFVTEEALANSEFNRFLSKIICS